MKTSIATVVASVAIIWIPVAFIECEADGVEIKGSANHDFNELVIATINRKVERAPLVQLNDVAIVIVLGVLLAGLLPLVEEFQTFNEHIQVRCAHFSLDVGKDFVPFGKLLQNLSFGRHRLKIVGPIRPTLLFHAFRTTFRVFRGRFGTWFRFEK